MRVLEESGKYAPLEFGSGLLAVYFSGDHWHRGEAIGEAIGEASAVILWTGETPQPASERIQLLRRAALGNCMN